MSICYRQDQPGWNQLVTVKQADQIIRGNPKDNPRFFGMQARIYPKFSFLVRRSLLTGENTR